MKKHAVLTALLALLLVLSACSGGAAQSSTPAAPSSTPASSAAPAAPASSAPAAQAGPVTLRYMSGSSGSLMQAEQQVIDRFTSSNPNVKVEVTTVTGTAEFITALKAKFSAGEAPDAYTFQGGNRVKEFAKAGLLYDMTDESFMNMIKEEDKPFNSFKGRVYGAPTDYQVTGLFINNNVLAQFKETL